MTDRVEGRRTEWQSGDDFLFTIFKTEEGVKFEGHQGTTWIALSFDLKLHQIQAIDERGMAND